MLRMIFSKLRAWWRAVAAPAADPAADTAAAPAASPSLAAGRKHKSAASAPSPREGQDGFAPHEREDQAPPRRRPRKRGGRGGFSGGAPVPSSPGGRPPVFEGPAPTVWKVSPPVDIPPQDTAFTRLGLGDRLAFAVAEMGYAEPTPIQVQAIPVVLAGGDVIGSAQTGTGKTAAFALPILHRLGSHGKLRCLVLEPTRELALQVEEAFQKFARHTDLTVTVVYGGVGYGKQRDDLRRGIDVLAATPGRLLDHIEQGDVRLDQIEILVLDEVDRMLDMGFLPDVRRIVERCPKVRQTLFFTATMPPELAQLAGWALHQPVEIKIGQRRSAAETVAHAFYPVVAAQKFDLLINLLARTEYKSLIIFTRTKMGADRIARRLETEKHTVGVIHSDRSQRERVEALQGFKDGRFAVLVATDIAARGLDIAGVSHVINYDVPENPEDYVHRIGRTGRAQTSGDAFTLVTEEDVRDARSIERFIGAAIERRRLDNFSYTYSALFEPGAGGAVETAAAPKPTSRLVRGARR